MRPRARIPRTAERQAGAPLLPSHRHNTLYGGPVPQTGRTYSRFRQSYLIADEAIANKIAIKKHEFQPYLRTLFRGPFWHGMLRTTVRYTLCAPGP